MYKTENITQDMMLQQVLLSFQNWLQQSVQYNGGHLKDIKFKKTYKL